MTDLGPCIYPDGKGTYRVFIKHRGRQFFARAGYDAQTAMRVRDRYLAMRNAGKVTHIERVHDLLHDRGVMTRAQLSQELGLILSTVHYAVQRLMQQNLVHEVPPSPGHRVKATGAVRPVKFGPAPKGKPKAESVDHVRAEVVVAYLDANPGSCVWDMADGMGFSARTIRAALAVARKQGRAYISGYDPRDNEGKRPRVLYSAGAGRDVKYTPKPHKKKQPKQPDITSQLVQLADNPFRAAMLGI